MRKCARALHFCGCKYILSDNIHHVFVASHSFLRWWCGGGCCCKHFLDFRFAFYSQFSWIYSQNRRLVKEKKSDCILSLFFWIISKNCAKELAHFGFYLQHIQFLVVCCCHLFGRVCSSHLLLYYPCNWIAVQKKNTALNLGSSEREKQRQN